MSKMEQIAQQEVDALRQEHNQLDFMVKVKIQAMIKPLIWDHYPADGRNPERWISKRGVVEVLDDGRYAAGLVARYETLEDAQGHYGRRNKAKVMWEHFGIRVEP